jgi:DNA-binding NarL/FixJ family response regulator
MAAELHISTATVRNHIQHILGKLQCHSRLEALVRAIREGLI